MQFFPSQPHDLERRQGGGGNFLTMQGGPGNCSDVTVYSIENGKLFANSTTSGISLQYSTDPGVPYQNFTPSVITGSINTTFAVDQDNHLIWNNPAFPDNQASFCIRSSDNTVVAVFDVSHGPSEGCMYVQLGLTRLAAACGNSQFGGPGPSDTSPFLAQIVDTNNEYGLLVHKGYKA